MQNDQFDQFDYEQQLDLLDALLLNAKDQALLRNEV